MTYRRDWIQPQVGLNTVDTEIIITCTLQGSASVAGTLALYLVQQDGLLSINRRENR
jgi:hypothetical protein